MKIIDSDFSKNILKTVKNSLGNIFFFEDIAVVELNEGVHFDMNNSAPIIDELRAHYGDSKPYGVVANRVNSYSVNLMDAPYFKKQVKNMKAYGVIGHDLAGKMNAEVENSFCLSEKIDYDTISEAIEKVSERVKRGSISLN
ncbi:hypothetical protein GSB9_00702 [Flavobacteriaceae bacterium GSB9]|nr:hypothetical protein GSB9_00702 [Flavobacteriaceae bacterium GSB9]